MPPQAAPNNAATPMANEYRIVMRAGRVVPDKKPKATANDIVVMAAARTTSENKPAGENGRFSERWCEAAWSAVFPLGAAAAGGWRRRAGPGLWCGMRILAYEPCALLAIGGQAWRLGKG